MKTFIAIAIFSVSLAFAGPLKTVSYPVVHPVKTAQGVKTGVKWTVRGLFHAVKALTW